MIYIAIATMGNQENIDRLMSYKFWHEITSQVACIYVLSQVESVKLKPRRGLVVEYTPKPLGCGGARQKMADVFFAMGMKPDDCIVFLDDDIEIVEAGWLQKLIAPLSEGYDMSGVEGRKLTKKMPKVDNKNFDYLSGGWLAVLGEVFDYKCAFDMQFNPNYFEDVDLCFQAKTFGFKLACVGDIGLSHKEELKEGAQELLVRNRALFYKKWGLDER